MKTSVRIRTSGLTLFYLIFSFISISNQPIFSSSFLAPTVEKFKTQRVIRIEEEKVNTLFSCFQGSWNQIKAAEAVRLSASLASFSEDVFEISSLRYKLLQVLVKTHQAPPLYDTKNPQLDFRENIQQNILNPLKKARPNWFQEALAFLENEATFEGIVSFLGATGWIDGAIQMELAFQKKSSPNFEKIKTLLKNKMVATAETLSYEGELTQLEVQIHANVWPKKRTLSSAWDQLLLFNFIKRKLFFSEQPWDNTTHSLFFLSPENFKELAQTAQSMDRFPSILAKEFGLKKAKTEARRLYKHTFETFANSDKNSLLGALSAAHFFFEKMQMVLASSNENEAAFFSCLPPLMNISGLSPKAIKQFMRCFFYYHIEQKTKKELAFLASLTPQIQTITKKDWLYSFLNSLEKATKTDQLYSYAYFYLNDLIRENEDQSKPREVVLTLALTSLKLLFTELEKLVKIKNTPLQLLERLKKLDKELAYSLGLELLLEKGIEGKLINEPTLHFPLLEQSLKTLFQTYSDSTEAQEAIKNHDDELHFLSLWRDPVRLIQKYRCLFLLCPREKQNLIPSVAKNIISPLFNVSAVEESILQNLRAQFQNNVALSVILKSAETQIEKAPYFLLKPFEKAPYLREIREKLELRNRIDLLDIAFKEALKKASSDFQLKKSKAALELMTCFNRDGLLYSKEKFNLFIQTPINIPPSLLTPYETQIKRLLAPADLLEESL